MVSVVCDESMQFQPKLFINKEIVSSVKSGESFRYLDDEDHKVQIQSCLLDMLQRLDLFITLPSNKLLLYHRWVLFSCLGLLLLQTFPRLGLLKT